jgi:hypothetical protein
MSDQESRKHLSNDPTAERTAEQSTQTAGGLSGGRTDGARPDPERDDAINRNVEERYRTPRKYEEGENDPAMPADDSTLNTKI